MAKMQDTCGDESITLDLTRTADPTPLVIQDYDKNMELFKVRHNGDIYVRGVLTTDDAEIVRGLKAALKAMEGP